MDIVGDLNIETAAAIMEVCREKHQVNTKMIMSILDEYFIARNRIGVVVERLYCRKMKRGMDDAKPSSTAHAEICRG